MTSFNPLKERVFWLSVALIFVVGAILYLPLSNQLGFYYNDWHPLASWLTDSDLTTFFSVDRPMLGWLYTVTHAVLGDHPLAWQLFTYFWRFAGAAAFLWLVNLLWPRQWAATTVMGLVFILYPGFLQQPIALTFSNHFMGYALGITSVALTVHSLQTSSRVFRILGFALSLVLQLIYIFIYEYMIGLEAVRLVLIIYILYRQGSVKKWLDLLVPTIRVWVPYVIVSGIFLYWRLFVFYSTRPTTNFDLLTDNYSDQPFYMIGRLIIETFRDYIETVVFAWAVPLYQTWLDASYPNLLISLLLGVIIVLLLAGFFRWLRRQSQVDEENDESAEQRFMRDAVWLGALATLFMIFPVVLSNREVQFRQLLDRYTLHTTIGVGMLTGGILFAFFKRSVRRWILVGLILISSVTVYNTAVHYKTSWDYQKQLWWQMSWRAPQIEPETVLMVLLPQGHRMMEDEEIYVPANLIYYPTPGPLTLVSEVIEPLTAMQVQRGEMGERVYRSIAFRRDFSKALIASIPNSLSCLHVHDGDQVEVTLAEDPILRSVAAYSRAERIMTGEPEGRVPEHIFGRELEHGWCYYYQKASLARQMGDWEEIARLAGEAGAQGLAPSNPVEWLPFYEAFVNLDRPDPRQSMRADIQSDPLTLKSLCLGLQASPGAYSSPDIYRQMVTEICGEN